MIEAKEILRLWLAGVAKKQIARQLGIDPTTVRRRVGSAEGCRLDVSFGPPALTDGRLGSVSIEVHGDGGLRPDRRR